MKIIKKNNTKIFENSHYCKAIEYPLKDNNIDGSIIKLNGRYPSKNRIVNNECKEMAYIINGSGRIVVEDQEYMLNRGDLILIDVKEKYYWEGNLEMFVSCTPPWNANQHREVK